MNLLAAKLYDPGTAVSKSTASLLAMTAFDTTNLRVAVTVPAHGMIYVRIMGGAVTGATTVPTLFLGVMNGSTVLARITPQDFPGTMNATTQSCPLYAECVITGLTPGAMNLDLAYGVEVVVASTAIKYGGPNNTTTNDAWGGISFQVWDPQPMATGAQLAIDSSGQVKVGTLASGVITATSIAASALNGKGDWNVGKTGYSLTQSFPTNFSALAITVGGAVTAGTVGDKSGYSLTTADWAKAGDAMALTAAYDAAKTAATQATANAIKAKTDSLNFTVAGKVDAGVCHINGVTVTGSGTSASPWGPA